jgi:hypothetical protein
MPLKILPVKRPGEQTATTWKFRTMSAALRGSLTSARQVDENRLIGQMPAKSRFQ